MRKGQARGTQGGAEPARQREAGWPTYDPAGVVRKDAGSAVVAAHNDVAVGAVGKGEGGTRESADKTRLGAPTIRNVPRRRVPHRDARQRDALQWLCLVRLPHLQATVLAARGKAVRVGNDAQAVDKGLEREGRRGRGVSDARLALRRGAHPPLLPCAQAPPRSGRTDRVPPENAEAVAVKRPHANCRVIGARDERGLGQRGLAGEQAAGGKGVSGVAALVRSASKVARSGAAASQPHGAGALPLLSRLPSNAREHGRRPHGHERLAGRRCRRAPPSAGWCGRLHPSQSPGRRAARPRWGHGRVGSRGEPSAQGRGAAVLRRAQSTPSGQRRSAAETVLTPRRQPRARAASPCSCRSVSRAARCWKGSVAA